MFKNIITYFAICITLMISPSASADTDGCTDFLQELKLKPAELKYQSCKKVEEPPAVLLKSYYLVSGSQAQRVEDFLHKEFGLERLRFVCCGYESRMATYFGKDGATYSINMYSDDEYSFQEKWEDYKAFQITVGKYLVLP